MKKIHNETLELRIICGNDTKKLFDFPYNFYDEELKNQFEIKFCEHFYFDEIGFETIDIFKQRLRSKLNMIFPYYAQLYETQLASKDINFLLNKDLKETFIRELNNMAELNSSMTNENIANTDNQNISFDSMTPQGKIEDIENYMTTASKSNDKNINNVVDNNSANSVSNTSGTEKTELVSQGNIGITSSGQLLKDWRDVIINIDEMIINECKQLFLLVY